MSIITHSRPVWNAVAFALAVAVGSAGVRGQGPSQEFLPSEGTASPIEIGMPADEIRQRFGPEHIRHWWGARRGQAPKPVYSRLSIGVVRGDGILLPLASKENETWTILRSLSSVGDRSLYRILRRAERAAGQDGPIFRGTAGVARPLTLHDMVTTDAHCGRQEGFATNAPPPGSKLDSPHLMSGVALHGDVSAVRIEDMVHQPDAIEQPRRAVRRATHSGP